MYHSKGFEPLPRAAGPPAGPLAEAIARLEATLPAQPTLQMRGLMLAVDGRVEAQRFWPPCQAEDMVWPYSISKSFTATAVGFAVDEGLLSPEDPVLPFFPQDAPPSPGQNLQAMRVRHLLSMATGHAEDTLFPMLRASDVNWARAFLALPVAHAPGSQFVYNSGASYMLAAILRRATGQSLMDWLAPRLFAPLGFADAAWDRSPQGVETGGWGIQVRLEDLLKLGELYRCGGVHGGRRVLSEGWVRSATAPQADNSQVEDAGPEWNQGYGYQFWLCRHGAFRADGAFGQFCIVMPRHSATLALMCETRDPQRVLDAVWETLLPALAPRPGQDAARAALEGKTFHLEENPLGIKKAAFRFAQDGTLHFTLIAPGGDGPNTAHTLAAGLGHWLEGETTLPLGTPSFIPYFAFRGRAQPVSAWYGWAGPDTLELHWAWRETPHRDRLICRVAGDTLTLTCPQSAAAEWAEAPAVTLRGRSAPATP